jgi:hypothetical protein
VGRRRHARREAGRGWLARAGLRPHPGGSRGAAALPLGHRPLTLTKNTPPAARRAPRAPLRCSCRGCLRPTASGWASCTGRVRRGRGAWGRRRLGALRCSRVAGSATSTARRRAPQLSRLHINLASPPDHYKAKYAVDKVAYVDEMPAVLSASAPPCLHLLAGINTDSGSEVAPPALPEGLGSVEVDTKGLFPAITEVPGGLGGACARACVGWGLGFCVQDRRAPYSLVPAPTPRPPAPLPFFTPPPPHHAKARVHKSPLEVDILRYANRIGSRAHVAMMEVRRARPSLGRLERGVRFGVEAATCLQTCGAPTHTRPFTTPPALQPRQVRVRAGVAVPPHHLLPGGLPQPGCAGAGWPSGRGNRGRGGGGPAGLRPGFGPTPAPTGCIREVGSPRQHGTPCEHPNPRLHPRPPKRLHLHRRLGPQRGGAALRPRGRAQRAAHPGGRHGAAWGGGVARPHTVRREMFRAAPQALLAPPTLLTSTPSPRSFWIWAASTTATRQVGDAAGLVGQAAGRMHGALLQQALLCASGPRRPIQLTLLHACTRPLPLPPRHHNDLPGGREVHG